MSPALRVTALLAASGALLGFSASLVVPHRYMGHAVLGFIHKPGAPQDFYRNESATLFNAARQATLADPSLDAIIRHSDSYKLRMYTDAMPDLMKDFREHTRIAATELTGAQSGMVVDFEDDDRDTALEIDGALVSALSDNTTKAAGVPDSTKIVQTPELELIGMTPALLTGGGLAMGAFLGLLAALLTPRGAR